VIKFTTYFTLGKGHAWEIFTKCWARLGQWLVLSPLSEKVAKKPQIAVLVFRNMSPNVESWTQHATSVV
jgi:hypothetical protein